MIDVILKSKKVTLQELQSIAGVLAFFTKALPGARVFVRRLYDSMKHVFIQSHHIRVSSAIKADLRMWKFFSVTLMVPTN